MARFIFIASLFLLAACNTSVHSDRNNAADSLNTNIKTLRESVDSLKTTIKTLTDSIAKKHIADSLAEIDSSNHISLDSADGIVLRIIHKAENENYKPAATRKDTQLYSKKFRVAEIFTENGYLFKAQRTHAVYDKYFRLSPSMDGGDGRIDFPPIKNLISEYISSFRDSIRGIITYLKRNKGSCAQILDYFDLRYGQMCNPMASVRAELIAAYMVSQGVDSSSCIAVGFGYDEPYVMKENNGVFKKGDTLDGEYISKLKKGDQKKAYDILNGASVEVIILPPKA